MFAAIDPEPACVRFRNGDRHCADRYEVSFTATALKWLASASLCAVVVVVVVATNGFVQLCRRSGAAERSRIDFEKGMELPTGSIADHACFALRRLTKKY